MKVEVRYSVVVPGLKYSARLELSGVYAQVLNRVGEMHKPETTANPGWPLALHIYTNSQLTLESYHPTSGI